MARQQQEQPMIEPVELPTRLPDGFQPRPMDVLIGGSKGTRKNPGNKAWKEIILSNLNRHDNANSRAEKSRVVASIVENVRGHGVLFVQHSAIDECYYDIGNRHAREETARVLSDIWNDY